MAFPTAHSERLCRGLFVGAGTAAVAGVVALAYGADVSGGAEFARAGAWYLGHQLRENLLLWIVLVPTALVGALFAVVAWRARAAYAAQLKRGAVPAREKEAVSRERVRREAQQVVDKALRATRDRPGTLVDALLGLPVDLGAEGLLLEPGQVAAEITLQMPMERMAVGTLPLPLYGDVLARLRGVLGIGEVGDGRLDLRSGEVVEAMRVVLGHGVRGVKARLQVLSRTGHALTLEELEMPAPVLRDVVQAIEGLRGVVLVAAPRGQGASTMLYAMAHYIDRHLQRPGLVASVERPVRRELPFLHQTDVGGSDPARVLAGVLGGPHRAVVVRHLDDEESLRVAFASAEQRLIVGCLAASSAAQAIQRAAAAVGRERVAARLALATGQRLLQRLCPVCRADAPPSAQEVAQLSALGARAAVGTASRGRGCDSCGRTGYAGKLLVFEVIKPGEAVAHALAAGDDAWRAVYGMEGNLDLLTAALAEVQRGRTSVGQVIAMAQAAQRREAR